MLTVTISASVLVFISILALKCVNAVRNVHVAHEELEERILLLEEVASGEQTARGLRALSQARPMRRILADVEDDLPELPSGIGYASWSRNEYECEVLPADDLVYPPKLIAGNDTSTFTK